MRIFRVLVVAALISMLPAAGAAQDEQPGADGAECELVGGVMECGTDVLDVSIEAPEATYILQPTNLTFQAAALETTFLPELLQTVTEGPL